MRRVRSVIVSFFITSVCLTVSHDPSMADESQLYDEGDDWSVYAYNTTEPENFQFCANIANYENGRRVTFLLSDSINFGIAITNPDWALKTDGVLEVEMELDSRRFGVVEGIVIDPDRVQFDFDDDIQTLTDFSQAEVFTVISGKQTLRFDIEDMGPSFSSLFGCVESVFLEIGVDRDAVSANRGAQQPAKPVQQPTAKLEAPDTEPNTDTVIVLRSDEVARSEQGDLTTLQGTAQFVLSAAGINFEFVALEGEEPRPNNINWVTDGDVVGGAFQTSIGDRSPQDIALGLANVFGSTCEGDFASAITNTVVAADQTELRDARIVCTGDINAMYTYALLLATGETSTVFFHIADEDAKETAQRNTDGIRAILAEALE